MEASLSPTESLSAQMTALVCCAPPLEDPVAQMLRSMQREDLIPPNADAILSTVQPTLDVLADFLRQPWTPQTHHLFPPAAREYVRLLLLVGQALWLSRGHAFRDAWLSGVIPHAVRGFRVRRQAPPLPNLDDE